MISNVDLSDSIYRAQAQVAGLRSLACAASEEEISCLTGFQLDMLLEPIDSLLKSAKTALSGGDHRSS